MYLFIWCAIVFLSYSLYSSTNYSLLNSDDALNVLMAHYYEWPHDIYCWGQDRGGTIIPLLAQLFIKLFRCTALQSVSIANYLVLIIGYFSFAHLLKSRQLKLVFAVLWFLPFHRFIDLLRFPIGVEYSIVGICIYLLTKLKKEKRDTFFKPHLIYIALIFLSIIAVWVSDLALVNLSILYFVYAVFAFRERLTSPILLRGIVYFLLGAIALFVTIRFAKSHATAKVHEYTSLNHVYQVKQAMVLVGERIFEVISFQTNEPAVSVAACLGILFLIAFFIYVMRQKRWQHLLQNKLIVFVILDMLVVLSVLFLASWVLKNQMGRWYFVGTYISMCLLVLYICNELKNRVWIQLLSVLSVVGALSTLLTLKYVNPGTLTPTAQTVKEFEQLDEIGIIADFWSAYISSVANPEMIVAIPNDKGGSRSDMLIDKVFSRSKIYVVRDNWMDNFPDTLYQYGYELHRISAPFRLANCDVCQYKRVMLHRSFNYRALKYPHAVLVYDDSLQQQVIQTQCMSDSCGENYFVYGPYISLGKGRFKAVFHLQMNQPKCSSKIAMIDVSSNYGEQVLASKQLQISDSTTSKYTSFELDFTTASLATNIEFRMKEYGHAKLRLHKIDLEEIPTK